jgi:hypothetical protein
VVAPIAIPRVVWVRMHFLQQLEVDIDDMFRDDGCPVRTDHAPANFITIYDA